MDIKIKHNKAHTWITDGYCHACRRKLTSEEIEEEFSNAAPKEMKEELTEKQKGFIEGVESMKAKALEILPEEKNGIVGIKGDSNGVHYIDIQSAEIGEWNAAIKEIKKSLEALDALNKLTP